MNGGTRRISLVIGLAGKPDLPFQSGFVTSGHLSILPGPFPIPSGYAPEQKDESRGHTELW
jgi:hypothetical protein